MTAVKSAPVLFAYGGAVRDEPNEAGQQFADDRHVHDEAAEVLLPDEGDERVQHEAHTEDPGEDDEGVFQGGHQDAVLFLMGMFVFAEVSER